MRFLCEPPLLFPPFLEGLPALCRAASLPACSTASPCSSARRRPPFPAGTPRHHGYVRRKAVEYMRAARGDFEAFLGEDFASYLR
jgi:hypothetical protein